MRYFMFNKPRGCVTACRDERNKTVMDYFPIGEREGLFPVGRLDKDTEGLLLVTDDGMLCSRLLNPEHKIGKTYFFWAKGLLDEEKIRRIESGLAILDRGAKTTAPAKVELLSFATLRDIADFLDEDPVRVRETRKGDLPVTSARLTITEGKKHQVKRMVKEVGLHVEYLERVSFSGLMLDPTLPRGAFRPLTEEEISLLKT